MVRYTLSTTFIAIFAALTGTIPQKAWAQENENDLTINQAIELMLYNNSIIQQAQKGVEIAQAEKQKLNSTWYPLITAGGTYMHFSNDIEAKESVKELLEPFKEALPEMDAIAQQLGPAIDGRTQLLGDCIHLRQGLFEWFQKLFYTLFGLNVI